MCKGCSSDGSVVACRKWYSPLAATTKVITVNIKLTAMIYVAFITTTVSILVAAMTTITL
jgi:hypothetical protein